ncbi:MAG: ABC transporter permease [Rubrimonas sp.]
MSAPAEIWAGLPAAAQDWLILAAWLAPGALVGALALRGYRAGPMVGALLRRHAWTNAAVVALVAVSVALGAAVTAQERALREGVARAADRFPLIVAAPGDQIRAMLAAVYLQPSDVPLLDGRTLARLQADPQIRLVAPLAFGDSHAGAPVVGATAAFARHLAGEPVEGRMFAALDEAVVGARSSLAVGDRFTPVHGHGHAAAEAHDGVEVLVVGRMAPTGSPWDRAILTPVEHVWAVHGLAQGHAPENAGRLGPPFDPDYFPGAPAFVVAPDGFAASYTVQARHDGGASMAFFPAAVLGRLLGVVGDVRAMMSLMATVTQGLVAAGALLGLLALMRLFARRLALLRALGAPRRFVFAVVWAHAAALLVAGAALGLVLGVGAAHAISAVVQARTDLAIAPAVGFREAHMTAAFFSLSALMALGPALAAYARPPVEDLRAA